MIACIVAVDNNYGIGFNNDLLISIPNDLKNFKEKTLNKTVIIGRKTYDSLPKKPLSNRENIIITSSINTPEVQSDGTVLCNMEYIKAWLTSEKVVEENNGIYIIGGGVIYKELLPYCERVFLTRILHSYENVDTYFPNIDEMPEWEVTSVSDTMEYEGIQYQFCVYDRIDYEIENVMSVDNDVDSNKNDLIVVVRTHNTYKTVIVKYKDDKRYEILLSDEWDYLSTNKNLSVFLSKVEERMKQQ